MRLLSLSMRPLILRFAPLSLLLPALVFLAAPAAYAGTRVHRGPTSPHLLKSHAKPHAHSVPKPVAVRSIAPERATEIQNALIRSGYLTGAPSGEWDQPTQAAMQKLQADNGWQTKLTPDSRAIIKLGLGSNGSASPASPDPISIAPAPVADPRHADLSLKSTDQ